jgi:integrase
VLAIVRKMMNWHARRNGDYNSPVVRGMHRHGTHKRERWLNDAEIRALRAACRYMGTFGALVRTLLVSGQRLSKVASLKWEDLADGEWNIAREARE